MPQFDAEGHQVWNPSVGIYHKPAAVKRESYGGIIGALQDRLRESAATVKSYPENFAGIIAAIQDLRLADYNPGSDIGPRPPGDIIIINPDTGLPENKPGDHIEGQLWFDTRQGRLFVWVNDEWVQTNGGDGLALLTDNAEAPNNEHVVPGQFWWNRLNNELYIFDGYWVLPNGYVTEDSTAQDLGAEPLWKLVSDSDGSTFQTTATLPLTDVMPLVLNQPESIVNPPDLTKGTFDNQRDYNHWVNDQLQAIDAYLGSYDPVEIGETPPVADDPDTNPLRPGTLWFDTNSLEMSIWYDDGDTQQWVPVSTAYNYDYDLDVVTASLNAEVRNRERAINAVYARIAEIDSADLQQVQALQQEIAQVEAKLNAQPTINLQPYPLRTEVQSLTDALHGRISELENSRLNPAELCTRAEFTPQLNAIESLLYSKVSVEELDELTRSIPDVSEFVRQQDINASIDAITVDYLPRNGGTVHGSFIVNKIYPDLPALDFSGTSYSSRSALKFKSNAPGDYTSSFGSTDRAWEYAWNFEGHEDYCWIFNDSNKVFSITKDGPACSTLYFGDFQENNNTGRVIVNKIDVKERLNTYQAAFEQVRQGVANSTDFDSLKANILSALANV